MLSYWIDVNVYGLCQGYFFIQDCQKMQYNGHSNVDGTMLKKKKNIDPMKNVWQYNFRNSFMHLA